MPNPPSVVHILQREPSFAIQAYLLSAEIPFTVENIYYPSALSTGVFPQLRHGSKVSSRVRLVSNEYIISYLKENIVDIDKELTEEQQILNSLICNTVEKKLNVALLYSRWVGWHFEYKDFYCKLWKNPEEMFQNAIRRECEAHGISFLSSLIAPSASFVNEYIPEQCSPTIFFTANESMRKIKSNNMLDKPVESIVRDTMNDYALLERLLSLSSTKYFHSNSKPSSSDVVVFEHLANAFNETISNYGNLFQKKFTNLWKLYTEMNEVYFTQDGRVLNHIAVNTDNKYYTVNRASGRKQRKLLEEYKASLILTKPSTPVNSPVKDGQGVGQKPEAIKHKTASSSDTPKMETPRGAFRQARHYEHSDENCSNKRDKGESKTTSSKKTKADETKEFWNKVFIGGIIVFVGVYAFQNYTPDLEEEIADDMYAVY